MRLTEVAVYFFFAVGLLVLVAGLGAALLAKPLETAGLLVFLWALFLI